jgi:hypothetical protein
MKTIKQTAILIALFLNINVLSYGQIGRSDVILSDTTWSSDTLKIYNDIVVESQVTLTIDPGVYVEFQGNYSINVYGKITAIGSVTDSITFIINDTTKFADTATYAGGWGSIKLLGNDIDTSFFHYCRFSYGKAVSPGSYPNDNYNEELKGGCLYLNQYHSLIITNCLFNHNFSTYKGGGIYLYKSDNLFIENNKFKTNRTFARGGAIYAEMNKILNISNNLFYSNISFKFVSSGFGNILSGNGAAIYSLSNYQVVNIANNRCFNNKCVSGVIYEANNNSQIINNTVTNNYGIGLFNGRNFGNQKYYNNTVCLNYLGGQVTGLMYFNNDLELKGNIFWGNEHDSYFPHHEIENPDGGEAINSFNCFQNGNEGIGNIEEYPEFTNPTNGTGLEYDGLNADWTLLNASPCINKGTPDTTNLNLPQYDIAGNPRVFGGRIDMGAYENQNVYVKINDSPVYSKIKLYPNPGTDKIFIDIPPEMNGAWIDIVDGQGRVLMHEQISFSPAILSPYKLQSGIYFYRIYNENKVVKSGKWVKR